MGPSQLWVIYVFGDNMVCFFRQIIPGMWNSCCLIVQWILLPVAYCPLWDDFYEQKSRFSNGSWPTFTVTSPTADGEGAEGSQWTPGKSTCHKGSIYYQLNKSKVFDEVISGQHHTCNTSYVITSYPNIGFLIVFPNKFFCFCGCSFAGRLEQVCWRSPAFWQACVGASEARPSCDSHERDFREHRGHPAPWLAREEGKRRSSRKNELNAEMTGPKYSSLFVIEVGQAASA